jgi:malonyl-CoA O-methyltransferase
MLDQHLIKDQVAKSFSAAADDYDQYARIQHKLAHELLLLCPKQSKTQILDLGCGTGYCLPQLNKLYPSAHLTGGDLAQGMLQHAKQHYPDYDYQISDAENLPFENEQFDLIFSSLAVQWCDDFSLVLKNAYRCLKPGGHLVLSNLSTGTLREMKQAWQQVDENQHVNEFASGNELTKAVEDSDFNIIKIDENTHVDYHPTVRNLTDSLKRIGAHNITQGRAKGLTSPATIKRFKKAIEEFRGENGLPASYEVFSCVLEK